MKRNLYRRFLFGILLIINILFILYSRKDFSFFPNLQETKGTIIRMDPGEKDTYLGKQCTFTYIVNGKFYRGNYTYLCEKLTPTPLIGEEITVSYNIFSPTHAKQGMIQNLIIIFILKLSLFATVDLLFLCSYLLNWFKQHSFVRQNYAKSKKVKLSH